MACALPVHLFGIASVEPLYRPGTWAWNRFHPLRVRSVECCRLLVDAGAIINDQDAVRRAPAAACLHGLKH